MILLFPNLPLPTQVAPNRMEQKEYYLAMQHYENFLAFRIVQPCKTFWYIFKGG